jgi:hypothetical protein
MGMTCGFEQTKLTGDYNIVQRETCSQRQNWIWFSVQPERIEKLPGEKNNNINIYIYLQYAQLLLMACLFGKMLFRMLFLSHQVLNNIILSTRIGPISNTSNYSWGPKERTPYT